MVRALSTNPTAIAMRKQSRKGGRPKLTDVIYFISLDAIAGLRIQHEGRNTTIGRLSEEQFKAWFQGTIDASLDVIGAHEHDANIQLLYVRKECEQMTVLDDVSRFYLINQLYRLKAFRDTCVPFVEREEQAS